LRSCLQRTGRSIFKSFELLFFPSFCCFCTALLEHPMERMICRECLQHMKQRSLPACPSCGRFYYGEGDMHLCQDCQEKRPPFSVHRSCAEYRGLVKDVLLLYKFKKIKVFGECLSGYIFEILGEDPVLWWGLEGIIPVPLHPSKKRERGFNQSEIIARKIAKKKEVPLLRNCLLKRSETLPQTSLESIPRRTNVKGAFIVKDPKRIEDKILLLVDDVYTTGATLNECSSVLIRAGAKEVRAITIAQA